MKYLKLLLEATIEFLTVGLSSRPHNGGEK